MSLFALAAELEKTGESFVIITLLQVRGGAPQDPGAKCIVTKMGLHAGTVGGGKVEARVIEEAKMLIQKNQAICPTTKKWNLQVDIGMTCGGEVEFLFELSLGQSFPIVIFGAGHVAQALVRTLMNLNCSILCIDEREEWISKLPIKGIVHERPAELVKEINPKSFFICMTQGHAKDTPILHAISQYAPTAPYVGVIGSKTKGIAIKRELKDLGVDSDFLEKLRVPIGLPLGNNDPFEIAISICAELIQIRDQN